MIWARVRILAAAIACWAGFLSGAGGQKDAPSERGRRIDVGTHRLYLDCIGQGSPKVILEGGAGTWSLFYRHIQDEVARDTRVCTYDRAGYGASDEGPAPRTASVLADELHRLLQTAGEEPPYLLAGHSLGGYILRIYQRRHAAEVTALVLVESGHEQQWTRLPAAVRESVKAAVPQFRAAAEAARAGELQAEHLDPWPFKLHGTEHRAAYARAMLTPKTWLAMAAEFEAAEESARQVPRGGVGNLPLVVVTAGRSFDAFVGSPIPIEESNPVWLDLQSELLALSTAATQILSPQAHHNIDQSDPATFVQGIRRGIAAARERGGADPPGPPKWFLDHVAAKSRDGGTWITTNPYKSADENFDAYGLEWRAGIGNASLVGRLYGIRDGREAGTFWEFREYWDPLEGQIRVQQFGHGGAYGAGSVVQIGPDRTLVDQSFVTADGARFRQGHLLRATGPDEHITDVFMIEDGAWRPHRSYTWRRQPPPARGGS